jgi:hypothetical protein
MERRIPFTLYDSPRRRYKTTPLSRNRKGGFGRRSKTGELHSARKIVSDTRIILPENTGH